MGGRDITPGLILDALRKDTCLDLRRVSARLGVDASSADLSRTLNELRRRGQIRHVGGKGRRTMFILATFED